MVIFNCCALGFTYQRSVCPRIQSRPDPRTLYGIIHFFFKGWRFQILYFQYIVQFAWDLCHCLHDWSLWELRDQFDLVWPQKYHECLSAFPTLSISPKWTIVKLLKRWLWSYWKGCPTQNRANWNFIQSNVWWCSWCSRFCTHLWCPEVKNMPEPIPICCQRSKAATFVESYERT